jgi:hypothetical protein
VLKTIEQHCKAPSTLTVTQSAYGEGQLRSPPPGSHPAVDQKHSGKKQSICKIVFFLSPLPKQYVMIMNGTCIVLDVTSELEVIDT